MTIAERIGRVSIAVENATRCSEFYNGVRHLMLHNKSRADLAAQQSHASDRVVDFVKAAETAGTTLSGQWGTELAKFQNLPAAFLSSLQGVSVFDTLLKDMLVVPERTSVAVLSSVLTSSPIAEAHIKPATQFSFSLADPDMKKAAPWVAVSKEELEMSVPAALTAVQSGLREKMTRACNTIFISAFSGVTSFASSGVTSLGVRQDIRTLLSAVSSGSESKLYLIVTRTICEALACLSDSAGAAAFPLMQYNGGSIAGIPVIPCDEMTAGEILLVDATQVAAVSKPLVFNASNQATVQMDDAPDSPPAAGTSMVGLWQTNLVGIIVERWIAVKLLRTDAAARITGVGYVGGSPA